jgi:uncharacterized membrane protein YjfL (UPF0719 family)
MKRKILILSLMFTLLPSSVVFAQTTTSTAGLTLSEVLSTIIYGVLGVLLSILGYFAFDRLAGLDLQRELVEDQNMALGIMLAGVFIGIAIVVSAAVA